MMGVSFDWAYWFMTALCFRPCDYALLWDPDSGLMYALAEPDLQVRWRVRREVLQETAAASSGRSSSRRGGRRRP